jgi:hypothetical protein
LAIETATYLSDLNVANPPGSDPVSQADDHIRLMKNVLKATFPNITGAVTATQAQLNTGSVPTGAIIMWSGATTAIPTGWALCDGSTYAKQDGSGNVSVPDLRDRFIVGAGNSYTVSATGGSTSNTPTISITSGSYALTQNDLPSYNLAVNESPHSHSATSTDSGHNHAIFNSGNNANGGGAGWVLQGSNNTGKFTETSTANITTTVSSAKTNLTVSSGGGGAAHSHPTSATSSSVSTLSPYYALAFIYKL